MAVPSDTILGAVELDDYASTAIKKRARQLVGHAGLTYFDIDDISQELWLELIRIMPQHDPSRASAQTFIHRVIDSAAAKLIRHRRAACRDYNKTHLTMDEVTTDSSGRKVRRSSLLTEKGYRRAFHREGLSLSEHAELSVDIADAVEQLPDDLRALCETLRRDAPLAAACAHGISRSTCHNRRVLLRKHLSEFAPPQRHTTFGRSDAFAAK